MLLAEVNEDGVMGYLLNKRYPRYFNELVEFSDSPPFPLFEGGPMEHEKLFFIHRHPELIDNGTLLRDNIYYGGNFKQAVAGLNAGKLNEAGLKMFIGYCGWDAGQIEEEIAAGDWEIANSSTIF